MSLSLSLVAKTYRVGKVLVDVFPEGIEMAAFLVGRFEVVDCSLCGRGERGRGCCVTGVGVVGVVGVGVVV